MLLAVTPRYTGTAQVLLDPRKEKIFGAESIIPELSLDTGNVDSQISVIESTNLLRRVVEKAKLTQDPEFGRVDAGLLSFFTSWFRSSAVETKAELIGQRRNSPGRPARDRPPSPGAGGAARAAHLRDFDCGHFRGSGKGGDARQCGRGRLRG